MESLKKILKTKLKGAKRIAVLGVGSELRGDDVAGDLVARELESGCKYKCKSPEARFFFGATAPENLTGEIKKFKPSHLIIIDSAELGSKPGTVKVLAPKDIGGVSFLTHRLPTKIMVDYLQKSLDCKVLVIGIQPKSLDFGKQPSKEVKKSAGLVSAAIKEALQAQS